MSAQYQSRYSEICKILGVPNTFCWHDFCRFFQNVYPHRHDIHHDSHHEVSRCCRPVASLAMVQPSSTFDAVRNAYLMPERDSVDMAREMGKYGSLSEIIGTSAQTTALADSGNWSDRSQHTESTGSFDELLKVFYLFDLSEQLIEKSSIAGRLQTPLPQSSPSKHYYSFQWDSNHDALENQLGSDLVSTFAALKVASY